MSEPTNPTSPSSDKMTEALKIITEGLNQLKTIPNVTFNPATWLSGNEIQFVESGFPYTFKVGVTFNGLNMWMEVYQIDNKTNPMIVSASGNDSTLPVRINYNNQNLPEPLLREFFLMSRNRVLVEWCKVRGLSQDENWKWFNHDKRNALKSYEDYIKSSKPS